ncbi:MAG TPA: N-6 DNA methylase [Pyrinomonadaceae bacterium]|nr:N-6 DNA methylase [Pyrinomonadaceae bacterium]
MSNMTSLDELISKKAAEFADQIKAAAAMADKEEEIRIEAERQLAFIQREAGIKLEGKHEFTVASGRVDSVYDRVIIEYKNPASPGARIGPKADSPGSRKVVEQIKKRFYDMRTQFHQPLNSLFGVGLDGNYFIFVRFRDEKWQVQEPIEVNRHSAERFLWALFNLGQKGKPFSPEYLAGDFGADAKLAQDGIRALYESIVATDHPKAQTFFNQWKILFGEVCGYDVDNPSDKVKKLAEFYGVTSRNKVKPAELLFAVHSYYALFMKLLASQIVVFFHDLPTPLARMMQAVTSAKLRREMEELEAGSIFRHLNITNFLEGDLFAWYSFVWDEPIEMLVRAMVSKLDEYNPRTMAEDPAGSRDLLKKLYQQLFPKSVRHDLGEYYTPDWLAEHVLNELEYVGDPDKRLLDPSCGSGTFLVMAINRIRAWYEQNRERVTYDEGELCRKILSNVIGFDLNPLAVMAARTNYLIAVRDLLGHVDKVEIPVYLCDSIMTPFEYGGLFAGKLGKAKELKTAVARFLIPTEVAANREDLAKYAEQLEFCVRNGYSPKEFIELCREESLPISEDDLHTALYEELIALDKANKNGVWARIIKNAFAPIFVGKSVDYIAGNPPWVNYENLPSEYREASADVWNKYGLFPKGGWRARFAKGNTELAMVFVYACMDAYLRPEGDVSLVITQSIFQSKEAGKGFRRFRISGTQPINILKVDDFTSLQPFEGATNRTAVFTANMMGRTTYPLPYIVWTKVIEEDFDSASPLHTVVGSTDRKELKAAPINDPQSLWMVIPSNISVSMLSNLGRGVKYYRAWKGADTRGGNGIFWLQLLNNHKNGYLCRNTPEFSKKKPPQMEWTFEKELVLPMLRGRETKRWQTAPSLFLLFPHKGDKAIPEPEMKRKFPKTYSYLQEMRQYLEQRRMYDLSRRKLLFYSLFETGDFLLAPYKVVWKEIATTLSCSVQEPITIDGKTSVVIPDHKLVIVPFQEKEPAFFLCAVLNSSISRFLAATYIVGTQIGTHILEHLKVPLYNPQESLHEKLALLSQKCHQAAAKEDDAMVSKCEDDIDEFVAKLLKVSTVDLRSIKAALTMKESSRPRLKKFELDDDGDE